MLIKFILAVILINIQLSNAIVTNKSGDFIDFILTQQSGKLLLLLLSFVKLLKMI